MEKGAKVEITLNGEKRIFSAVMTVTQLLKGLGLNPKTVLVELNLRVVPRGEMGKTTIHDGDVIEIIGIFGGG